MNNKIIEKIKKLLELTTSPNESEAKLAMERAQKLMAQHSISEIDITDPDNINIESKIIRQEYWSRHFSKNAVLNAMPPILSTIPPIFGCYALIVNRNQTRSYELVGFLSNIEITRFALDSLLEQGMLDYQQGYQRYRSISFGHGFWPGFATGIQRKFSQHKEESKGIILYDKVKQYLSSIATGDFNYQADRGIGRELGIESGLKAEIRKGIESTNKGKLLS